MGSIDIPEFLRKKPDSVKKSTEEDIPQFLKKKEQPSNGLSVAGNALRAAYGSGTESTLSVDELLKTVRSAPAQYPIQEEVKYTEPQFNNDDPVGSATSILYSRAKSIKIPKRQISESTSIQFSPEYRLEKEKQQRKIEADMEFKEKDKIPLIEVDKKVQEVRNFYSQNTGQSVAHLMGVTGFKPEDLYKDENEEAIRNSLRPGNSTDKISYQRLQEAKDAKFAINSPGTIEDKAISFAVKRGKENTKIISTLLGEETKGRLMYDLLSNSAVQQEVESNTELRNQYKDESANLMIKYPKFGRMLIGNVLSQEMEDLGMNNGILNIVTKEEADKVFESALKKGKLSVTDRSIYEKQIRPHLGLENLGRKIISGFANVEEVIDTPGLLESGASSFLKGLADIPKGVYEVSGVRELITTEEERRAGDLETQDKQIKIKPKGIWHEITQDGGNVLGQSLSIGGGGGLIKTIGVAKGMKTAVALSGGLQAYANYIPQARELFPGEGLKQRAYATILSGFEMATENIFNDRKVVDGLLGKIKPQVAETIKDFTEKKITALAAREQMQSILGKAMMDVPDAAKYFSKAVAQNTVEEVSAQLSQQVTDGVFEGKPFSEIVDAEELWNTGRQAFLSSLFIGGLATRSDLKNNRGITAKTIYEMAQDPQYWKDQIRETGNLDEELSKEVGEKTANLDFAAQTLSNLDENLTAKQKAKYVITALENKIHREKAASIQDPILKEKEIAAVAENEQVQKDILEGKDDGSIEGDRSDDQPQDRATIIKDNTGFLEEMFKEDALPAGSKQMLANENGEFVPKKTEEYLKFVAQQANNLDANGDINKTSDSRTSARTQIPEQIIEAANELFPEYKKLGESQGEPVVEEDNTTMDDLMGEEVDEADIVSVNDVIDQPGIYKGQRGIFYQDGKAVVFKVDGQNKEFELEGNIDEIGNRPIGEFGIEQETSVVSTNETGDILVRDTPYKNNYSDPLSAINKDSDGNIVSVTLDTDTGEKRTFRGDVAEDIAYQINLKEISKDNETVKQFEEFINSDEAIVSEINNAAIPEPTTETPTQNNEPVSRETIKPKPAVRKPKTNKNKVAQSLSTQEVKDNTPQNKGEAAKADKEKKDTAQSRAKKVYKDIGEIDEPSDARGLALEYFAGGGKVSESSVNEVAGSVQRASLNTGAKEKKSSEVKARDYVSKYGKTIDEIAHSIWDNLPKEIRKKISTQDLKNELMNVVNSHNTRLDAAIEFRDRYIAKDVRDNLTEEEAKGINDADIARRSKMVEELPENQKNELIDLLAKYENEYGIVDWERLEKDSNGFSPDILSLSNETQKALDVIIQKNISQTASEPNNATDKDGGSKEKAEERLKTAQSNYNKAAAELKKAEDRISQTQATQSGMFDAAQSGMFGVNRDEAKSILDPLRKKVSESKAELDKIKSQSPQSGKPELFGGTEISSTQKTNKNVKKSIGQQAQQGNTSSTTDNAGTAARSQSGAIEGNIAGSATSQPAAPESTTGQISEAAGTQERVQESTERTGNQGNNDTEVSGQGRSDTDTGKSNPTVDDLVNDLKKFLGGDFLAAPSDFLLGTKITLSDLAIVEGDTFSQIIDKVIDRGGEFTDLVTFLKGMDGLSDVKVVVTTAEQRKELSETEANVSEDFAALYNQSTNTIYLNPDYQGNNYYAIVHEAMHWHTLNANIEELGDKQKLDTLKEIFNIIKKESTKFTGTLDTNGQPLTLENYGLQNFKEFMAELMINPSLRNAVGNVVIADPSKYKTFVQWAGGTKFAELSNEEKQRKWYEYILEFFKDLMTKTFNATSKEINFDKPLIDNAVKIASDLFFGGQDFTSNQISPKGVTETVSNKSGENVLSAPTSDNNKKISDWVKQQTDAGVPEQTIHAALVKFGISEKESQSRVKSVVGKIEENLINSIGANSDDVLLDSVQHRKSVGSVISVEETAKADKLKLWLVQEDANGFIQDMKEVYKENYLSKSFNAINGLNKNNIDLDKILGAGIALENEINNIKDGFTENEFNISRSELNKVYARVQRLNVENARISSKALNTAKTLYNNYDNTVAKENILNKNQSAQKSAIMDAVLDENSLSEAAESHESGVRLTEEVKEDISKKDSRGTKIVTEKNKVKAKIGDILTDLKTQLKKLDC